MTTEGPHNRIVHDNHRSEKRDKQCIKRKPTSAERMWEARVKAVKYGLVKDC